MKFFCELDGHHGDVHEIQADTAKDAAVQLANLLFQLFIVNADQMIVVVTDEFGVRKRLRISIVMKPKVTALELADA